MTSYSFEKKKAVIRYVLLKLHNKDKGNNRAILFNPNKLIDANKKNRLDYIVEKELNVAWEDGCVFSEMSKTDGSTRR